MTAGPRLLAAQIIIIIIARFLPAGRYLVGDFFSHTGYLGGFLGKTNED